MTAAFFDSNVVIYLTSGDAAKAATSRRLLEGGGHISTQVLNETVAVLRRKNKLDWADIEALIMAVTDGCEVASVSLETHELARRLATTHSFHIYDASIIAAAKLAGCDTLWSEDMNDGQVVEGVTIRNPF